VPQPTVGLIGLGLMGLPMGHNLLKAGFPLVVWNRTASRADSLVAAGAKLAASPREVAVTSDVLLTIVSDPPALEEILWGSGEKSAFPALKKGAVYIDSSTVSPALARKIAAASTAAGIRFLDAPVTGGTWGAEKGELIQAEQAFSQVEKLGHADGPINLARVYLKEGRLDEAVTTLKRAARCDPPAPRWWQRDKREPSTHIGIAAPTRLITKNATELRDSFAKYVGAARKIGRSTSSSGRSGRRGGGTSTSMDRDQAAAIRSWAKKQGLKVSDRGRIPATIIEQYNQSA